METIPVWLLDDEVRDLIKVKKYLCEKTKSNRNDLSDTLRLVALRGLKEYYKEADAYFKEKAKNARILGKKLKQEEKKK